MLPGSPLEMGLMNTAGASVRVCSGNSSSDATTVVAASMHAVYTTAHCKHLLLIQIFYGPVGYLLRLENADKCCPGSVESAIDSPAITAAKRLAVISRVQHSRNDYRTPHHIAIHVWQQGCTHNDVLPGLVFWGHALNRLEVAAVDNAGQPCEAHRSSKDGDVP